MPSVFTPEQRVAYERDGYVMLRGLFDAEETGLMRAAIEQDPQLRSSLYERKDAEGKVTKMALWNHPGDSVYGLAARSQRVVDTMEEMLGGEVHGQRDGGAGPRHARKRLPPGAARLAPRRACEPWRIAGRTGWR